MSVAAAPSFAGGSHLDVSFGAGSDRSATPPLPPLPPQSSNLSSTASSALRPPSESVSVVAAMGASNSLTHSSSTTAGSGRPSNDTLLWLREKFPDLSAEDTLDGSYSCALVKSILIQGRLYVTSSALLFYAKIFGRVTKEMFPYSMLRYVGKRKSGFVANAIKVVFMDPDIPPVVFGSLSRRERTCALINARLVDANPAAARMTNAGYDENESPDESDMTRSQSANVASAFAAAGSSSVPSMDSSGSIAAPGRQPELAEHRTKSVPTFGLRKRGSQRKIGRGGQGRRSGSCDGSDSGTVSDEVASNAGDTCRPSMDGPNGGVVAHPVENTSVSGVMKPPGAVDQQWALQEDLDPAGSTSGSTLAAHLHKSKLVWRTPEDQTDCYAGKEHAKRTKQAECVLNAPVEVVFNELFVGDFVKDAHAKNGNTDLTQSEWARAEDGYMTRELRFCRALGYAIGPKSTRVVEVHKYSFLSGGGALFEMCGHNLDVPFGDHFRVESYLELFPNESNTVTTLTAYVALHFAKNTMLRNKIQTGALAETKGTFTRMLDFAEERIRTIACTNEDGQASSDGTLSAPPTRTDSGPGTPLERPLNHVPSGKSLSRTSTGASFAHASASVGGSGNPTHGGLVPDSYSAPTAGGARVDVAQPVKSSPASDVNAEIAMWKNIAIVSMIVALVLLVVCLFMLARLHHDMQRLEQLAVTKLTETVIAATKASQEKSAECIAAAASCSS